MISAARTCVIPLTASTHSDVMNFRSHLLTPLLVLTALASAACSQQGPLDELSDAERSYVIPNSTEWGSGPCAQEDCAGPFEAETIERYCWNEVDTATSAFGDGFFEIASSINSPIDDVVLGGEIPDETAFWMNEVRLAGHRLIVGTECPVNGGTATPILEAIAVVNQGRIAGIGTDPARTTTASLAEASAEDGAASGEDYLLSLLRS
ncbi:MAG: hypothetical protein ACI81L_002723 [Verrucomicrobiales bacterium]|jgi:hypothetical protein